MKLECNFLILDFSLTGGSQKWKLAICSAEQTSQIHIPNQLHHHQQHHTSNFQVQGLTWLPVRTESSSQCKTVTIVVPCVLGKSFSPPLPFSFCCCCWMNFLENYWTSQSRHLPIDVSTFEKEIQPKQPFHNKQNEKLR